MRTFALKAALAAALLTTGLIGAQAAPNIPGRPAAPEHFTAPLSGGTSRGSSDSSDTSIDRTITRATTPMTSMEMGKTTRTPMRHANLTRYERVKDGLAAANRRIAVDYRRGFLNRWEHGQVKSQARDIRHDFMQSASLHHGTLTGPTYRRLEGRLAELNRTIHRYVNNA